LYFLVYNTTNFAVFSNYFVNLLAGCIVCATIYLALAGV